MSETTDALRRAYAGFGAGDMGAVLAVMGTQIEWDATDALAHTGIYHGHEGVRRWWAATILQEELGSIEGRLEGVKEADDTVIASVRFEGEGRISGVRVPMHVHIVGTFRDGKIVRRQVFLTLAEALEAVGLRE